MKTLMISIAFFLFIMPCALAAITFDENGKWETTFDTTEQDQLDGDLAVDGLTQSGDWTCTDGSGEYGSLITSSANNPDGAGGLGFRQMVGDSGNAIGHNGSGNLNVLFPSLQKELWIRATIRYQSGFSWTGGYPYYDKLFYMYSNESGGNAAVWGAYPAGSGKWGMYGQDTTTSYPFSGAELPYGWATTYPTGVSDGSWFTIEAYHKMDDVVDGVSQNNGIAALWIDGNLAGYRDDFTWSDGDATHAMGWEFVRISSNQDESNPGECMGIDFDDIVIYNQTPPNLDANGNPFIGPIEGEVPGRGTATYSPTSRTGYSATSFAGYAE